MKMVIQDIAFQDFVQAITTVVEKSNNDMEVVGEVEHLLGKLIRNKNWLPIDKQTPNAKQYARHSLYHDPLDRFEIIALIWNPGQETTLHDHDGAWGVEGVLHGRIKVKNFLQRKQLSQTRIKLDYAGSVTLGVDSTGQLLPPADCHILKVDSNEKAVTIHIYGKKLKKFRVFYPTLEKNVYITEVCNIGYDS
ncbi:cysteine dioxygenase family protein [Bacillus cereus]|uniref:Cysteine dioxygenase n=2 Tax=Bacillus cereus group TaxID=86661 RepID=A0A1C4DIQ9_BACCE|nr:MULTISPECIES: cysteine dioxygenase family protein [Bacillus]EOP98701.1 hypothetical protein IIY_05242 [Bacillus cereus VD140]MBL3889394.1 cysteine dioxygenase family protein [Bacillus cereus]MCC2368509.1 cysteine dioxygenase family protein [Bacillus cereus]MCC2396590.1 cysteine dioxygenase family protein [Bacillus cereus]MCC2451527.1 cysteine dioxygenase family protein [Bacillus cereus]